MTLLLPGDVLLAPAGPSSTSQSIRLGPGLLSNPSSARRDELVCTRAGVLGEVGEGSKGKAKGKGKSQPRGLWIESDTRRYVPSLADSVIGQVTSRGPEFYTLSLSCAHNATLPVLSFAGATQRHRPDLPVGTLVYARVTLAERHTEPEVTCVDPVTGKAEGYGALKVGEREEGQAMVFRTSLSLARSLLRRNHTLLPRLSTLFPFEAAVGHNGLVWVRASRVSHIIAFGKVLSAADAPAQRKEGNRMEEDEDEEKETMLVDGETLAQQRGALSEERIREIVQPYM